MRALIIGVVLLVITLAVCPAAGDWIVYGSRTDHQLLDGASLEDVRLSVDLSVSDGVAMMTFLNASTGMETTAAMKKIVLDVFDVTSGSTIFWDVEILPAEGVSMIASMWVPTAPTGIESPASLVFEASGNAVRNGLGIGQSMTVRMATLLPDGAGMTEYLLLLEGAGQDRPVVGFHAVSASVIDGESLVGTTLIPEPGTLALVATMGVGLLARRRRPLPSSRSRS